MGAWVSYGLGTENENLPAFVVMEDNPGKVINGPRNWSAGFMPASFQGTPILAGSEPIQNLSTPAGISEERQVGKLRLLDQLNRDHARLRPDYSELEARNSNRRTNRLHMNEITLEFLTAQLELADQLLAGRGTMLEPQDLPGRYGRVIRALDRVPATIGCESVVAGGWAVWRHGFWGRVRQDVDVVLPADRIAGTCGIDGTAGLFDRDARASLTSITGPARHHLRQRCVSYAFQRTSWQDAEQRLSRLTKGRTMLSQSRKLRLLTRSDFDGLVCAVLLKEIGVLGDIKFVHPKDVQDGKIEVTDRDVLTNLPYVPGCYLCFDHHASELVRNEGLNVKNYVLDPDADSAARVVYDYYGGEERFSNINPEMLHAVDKADSAQFTLEDVLNPKGWVLLSFLMDARTGLGRFRDFRVSNYQLMMDLIEYCKDHTIEQILALPDVKERVELFQSHQEDFKDQLHRCSTVYENLVVLDLRDEETIFAGNRFMIYALFPECNISMYVIWGLKKQNTVFTIGKSIFNRTCAADVGELCLRYGGGGHANAGTCQIPNEEAERVKEELIASMTADTGALVAG